MTLVKKLEMLEEMMELNPGTLKPENKLSDVAEWDSIAVISFMALMDDEFGKVIKGSELKEFKTVSDILTVMQE